MIILIVGAVLGLVPASIASSKGRSFFLWWVYGALIFIIALPHSLLASKNVRELEQRRADRAPVIKGPSCAETIKADAKVCRYCQRDVTPLTAIPG